MEHTQDDSGARGGLLQWWQLRTVSSISLSRLGHQKWLRAIAFIHAVLVREVGCEGKTG